LRLAEPVRRGCEIAHDLLPRVRSYSRVKIWNCRLAPLIVAAATRDDDDDRKAHPKTLAQVRERYGDVCDRTLERAVNDGRLPPPSYPFNNKIPFWDEDVLEAHERTAVLKQGGAP